MDSKHSIPLSQLVTELQLEEVYLPKSSDEIMISTPEVSRPGLALSGFLDVFEPLRIQIIGLAEHQYLGDLSDEERSIRLENFLKLKPVAVVVTTNLSVFDAYI